MSSPSRFRLLGVLGIILVVLAGLLIVGILPRLERQSQLQAAVQEERSAPRVSIARPRRATAGELPLPGNIQALQETVVAARADGFVRRRLVDIGERVRRGQLLAEIETPELDQQLAEARASEAQAQAELDRARRDAEFARTTLERWQTLREQGAVSEQDTEERRSAYDVRAADVVARNASLTASTANIRRLSALQDFRNVTAPFAGVITERNTDTGALIAAGNTTPGLFRIASTDTLRIFVNVPQNFVRAIKPGQVARVEVQEYPGRIFMGRVARTAGALDASARTLRTEVRVPNSDGALLAGMYAQVKFTLPSGGPTLLIPASTLLIAGRGPQVAVLEANRVRFRSVRLGRDLGEEVEVTGGLKGDEQLVSNPSDAVREGTVVEPDRKKS